jgi:hypothetical protein
MNIRLFVSLLILPFSIFAQDSYNMAQFARSQNLGTARNMAAGGAFSPLGNDFSAIHVNPAGVGVFRKPSWDVTLGFSTFSQTSRSQLNGNVDLNGATATISNIGFVNVLSEERNSQQNFAFSFTQWTSFNNELQGRDAAVFNEGTFDDSLKIISSGYMGEIGLTYGGHTKRKFYYGIGVGIPIGRLQENFFSDLLVPETGGRSIIAENSGVSFIGINLKGGIIYRPIPSLRLSLAAHTPSSIAATGEIGFDYLTTNVPGLPEVDIPPATDFNYRYNFTLPARFNAGAAFVYQKLGLITFDYEFSNPMTGSFRSRSVSYDGVNQDIVDNLTGIHQLRSGVEVRLKNFFLRGGYSYSTSGFIDDFDNSGIQGIHTGAGFRSKNFWMDFAVVNFTQNSNRFLPNLGQPFGISTDRSQTYFMISATFLR